MRLKRGFSLLELLFVVAIIGIIVAYAIPYYSNHVTHTRRMQAEVALQQLSVALEQYHVTYNTYENASVAGLGLTDVVADQHYMIRIASASNTDYFLQAVPLGEQAIKDKECAALTLN